MNMTEKIEISFRWALTKDVDDSILGEKLYKNDQFLSCILKIVENGRAWRPISGGTRRAEPEEKLVIWIEDQMKKMRAMEQSTHLRKNVSLNVDEFPIDNSNKRTITTAKSIMYLLDSTGDLISCIETAFANGSKAKETLDVSFPALVYISNSIESGGRAFSGDPFTGQVAAFSRIFCSGILGNKERNFVAYYPHQLYTQFFNMNGKKVSNKGANILQSLADLIVTGKGVLIKPSEWRVL